uniref:Uncharacterized protein n=1 Tax=Anguilla anguilla TaxID=7936 RepID=A0A0E9X6L7_ANGAN
MSKLSKKPGPSRLSGGESYFGTWGRRERECPLECAENHRRAKRQRARREAFNTMKPRTTTKHSERNQASTEREKENLFKNQKERNIPAILQDPHNPRHLSAGHV